MQRKILFFIIFLFLFLSNVFAGEFWLRPKWGLSKSNLQKKYKLEELSIPKFKENLLHFLKPEQAILFKQYVVNEKKYYNIGGKKFFVIAGFFKNKLQYVIIATEEIDKSKINEEKLTEEYLSILGLNKKINMWTIGFTILSNYSIVGYGASNGTYFELHIPHGKSYIQYTNYRCNERFFKKLKLRKKIDRNEYMIIREYDSLLP